MFRMLFCVAVLVLGWTSAAEAGGCCCPQCGCRQLKKVCVPVRETKTETEYEYSAVCEDFCIPGRSKIVGHCHVKDCRGCEHCCPVRQPTCARVHTRVKLVKTPVTKEKCEIKWVVKTVCCGCGCDCHACGHGGCVSQNAVPRNDAIAAGGEMPAAATVEPSAGNKSAVESSVLYELLSSTEEK